MAVTVAAQRDSRVPTARRWPLARARPAPRATVGRGDMDEVGDEQREGFAVEGAGVKGSRRVHRGRGPEVRGCRAHPCLGWLFAGVSNTILDKALWWR